MPLSENTFLPSSTLSPSVFSPALEEKKTGKERALETGDTQQVGVYGIAESSVFPEDKVQKGMDDPGLPASYPYCQGVPPVRCQTTVSLLKA